MRVLPPADYLFLDFDGVICDSLEECYRSSWLAAEGWTDAGSPPPDPPFDQAYRARFVACRPFIRSGEDYLVAHEWAQQGRVPESQAEFDRSLNDKGAAGLTSLKQRLYAVREVLLSRHRALWLSWNPLYPGMAEALASQTANPAVAILSTKKAEFIVEILGHHGVVWPLHRTVFSGNQPKLGLIAEAIGTAASMLIDDQIDHLDFDHPSCRCVLALWGYVTPGVNPPAHHAFQLTQALEQITSFPRLPHPAGSAASARRP